METKWEHKVMTRERYLQLYKGTTGELTQEETAEGWHFCWDWDGLLIHKDDPEFDCCTCHD